MKNSAKRANFITFAIIGVIIVIGLGLLFFLNNANEETGVNAVTPDELETKISEEEEVVVYFWQTGCESVSYTHLTLPTTPYV